MESKYIKIYNYYLNKIKDKELKKGDFLPSESEIQKKFDVSRDTVKKAFILLKQHGLIEKMRGKKSVVIGFNTFDFTLSGLNSFKELLKLRGIEGYTKVLTLELKEADEEMKKLFNQENDFKYYYVERYRVMDGIKFSLDSEYILEKYSKGLEVSDLENSLYEYIENVLGHTISYTEKTIYADNASKRDREVLDMPEDETSMLIEESKSYLKNGILFHITRARHRKFYRFKEIGIRNKTL